MCVMWALKTWFLEFFVKNTIFCISGLMNARLSVLLEEPNQAARLSG